MPFNFAIHRLTTEAPKYNVLETKMEGWRTKRRLKSTAPQRRWIIEIRGRTTAEKDLILAHYNSKQGSLTPFYWTINPTFFGDATYYVTYEDFNYENPDGMGNIYSFQITLREELV